VTAPGISQLVLYFVVLLALAWPLGRHVARVLEGQPTWLSSALGDFERFLYRVSGVHPEREMGWQAYTVAYLAFNLVGLLTVYAFLRLQTFLPFHPAGIPTVPAHLAFNTAVSFATNTNWQSYAGESTLGPLVQMLALTTQNFVSAAAGIAMMAALVRGFARASAQTVGNFWVDLTRTTLYVLLPLSIVLAFVLVSQGVVQSFQPAAHVPLLEHAQAASGGDGAQQTIPLGPVASQIAIKQLGTNGGGYFNVNSAHPFENPTPISNFLELLAILLLPAALCVTFGRMVSDGRQGTAVLAAMTLLLVGALAVTVMAEQQGNPVLARLGVDDHPSSAQAGGNMEGKEARFGIANSALWAVATTAASNGSVNSMHDSFTPLGGLVPMALIQAGEVIYGGVGSGLTGMLVFALFAVFMAGLMVGRTPEYLGKKIEAYEMKMAALVILLPSLGVLVATAIACRAAPGLAGILNPGAHGFSEILYAYSSASNNNGSAFAGLSANRPFYDGTLGICMLIGRYGVAIPTFALAGSLAAKKKVPAGAGTLPTHTPLFIVLLAAIVVLVGALTFVPALALGPGVEHLMLWEGAR
jgi:K+-transporting ATPase ATPase A chain